MNVFKSVSTLGVKGAVVRFGAWCLVPEGVVGMLQVSVGTRFIRGLNSSHGAPNNRKHRCLTERCHAETGVC